VKIILKKVKKTLDSYRQKALYYGMIWRDKIKNLKKENKELIYG
tara:strand:+ start:766 stop:897 length:132 start_codon:yes stop_codon:yes gene_type:complete